MKSFIAVSALIVGLIVSVQGIPDDDYAEIEVPGVPIPKEEPNANDSPCFPDILQATLRIVGKRVGPVAVSVQFSKNSTAAAFTGGRFHNETMGFVMLVKGSVGTIYSFNLATKVCKTVTNLKSHMHPSCLPSTATPGPTFNIGPIPGGLTVTPYRFNISYPQQANNKTHHGHMSATLLATTVSGTFFPVAVQIRGGGVHKMSESESNQIFFDDDDDIERRSGKKGFFSVTDVYTNVTASFPPGVNPFSIPDFCTPQNQESVLPDMPELDFLRRFVQF